MDLTPPLRLDPFSQIRSREDAGAPSRLRFWWYRLTALSAEGATLYQPRAKPWVWMIREMSKG